MKDPRLYLFGLAYSLRIFAVYIPITFLPDMMAKEHNISHLMAGSIVQVYGTATMVGRLVSGIVANRKENIATLLNCIAMFIAGASCIGMGRSYELWHFMLCCFIWALFDGFSPTLLPIILVDMFGIDSLKVTFGSVMFGCGITSLLGTPFSGWLAVIFESYNIAVYVAGGIYLLAAVLNGVVVWLNA